MEEQLGHAINDEYCSQWGNEGQANHGVVKIAIRFHTRSWRSRANFTAWASLGNHLGSAQGAEFNHVWSGFLYFTKIPCPCNACTTIQEEKKKGAPQPDASRLPSIPQHQQNWLLRWSKKPRKPPPSTKGMLPSVAKDVSLLTRLNGTGFLPTRSRSRQLGIICCQSKEYLA